MQRGAEVDDAVRVSAHEVNHLPDAETPHLGGSQSHCVPIYRGRDGGADLEPQLAHEEVEVGVAHRRDQRGPGQAGRKEVTPFHVLREEVGICLDRGDADMTTLDVTTGKIYYSF